MNKQEIYDLLNRSGVTYEAVEHKAVCNMAQLSEIEMPWPEAEAKNLFVRDDKKQRYILITVKGEKRVDLKAFRHAHQMRPLSLATAEELMVAPVTASMLLLTARSPLEFIRPTRKKRSSCTPRPRP